MKKFKLFNQSFGTVGSPNQTGETQTRENRVGLMSYLRRTLMLLFAVLVMSIANIGMAWGTDLEIPLTNLSKFPLDYGLVTITNTENTTISNPNLTVKKATAKFKVETISGFYIKSISFTDANPSKNGGFTCDENASYMAGPTENVYTYTAPNATTSEANFTLIGSGGTAQIGTIIITVSTSNQVERLTAFGSISSYKIPFTSSAATTSIELSVPTSNGVSISSNRISIATSAKHLIVSTKNHEKIKYIAIPKYQQSTNAISGSSDPSGTYSSDGWTPSSSDVESVDLSLTASGGTTYSQEIFVVFTSAGGGEEKDYTVTAATSTGTNTYGTVSAAASSLDEDETTTITATPATGYQVTNWAVSGTGASISPSGASNSNTTTLTMGTANATVTVTFGLIDYAVTKTLTNCAVKDGSTAIPSTMNYGDDLSTIIEPTSGNLLPSSITVSGVTSYTWNAGTGALTLTDVTDNVSISISAAAPQTGSGATVTYALVTSGSTAATYSTGVFSNILSGGSSNKNTLFASNTLSGGNGVGVQSKKTTPSNSYTAGITSSTSAFDAASTPYVQFSFDVVDGYTFTPTGISVPVQPISNNAYFKILVTDGSSTWTTTSSECTAGSKTTITTAPTGGSALSGTVNVKVYCYSQATSAAGYRFATPVTVTGTVASAAPSCTDPDHVGISGSWRYFPGQTISLTATGYDDSDEEVEATGWQWQKEVSADNWSNLSNGTTDGVTISGATSSNLQISNCGTGNTGKYRCIVSTGATCSTTSPGFDVRIYTLNGAYDDNSFSSNNITYSSGTAGTATVHLEAGRVYKFKVTDNFGTWFGNSGKILEPAVNWDFSSGEDDNCVLFTGPEGDYTFTVDYDHADYGTPEVVVSVAYPSVTHPAAGYAYYKNVDSWEHVALHMWYDGGGAYTEWASDPWVTKTTTICGETYYYTPFIPSWYNRCIFHNAGGDGQTGDITVANLAAYSGKYNDKSDANWHSFTTYTITFAANGGSGTMSAITGICPDADQVLPANTFEKTGYTFAGWEDASGNEYDDEATIEDISDDITLTAQWSPVHYDVSTSFTNVSVKSGTTGTGAATHGTAYTVTLQGATGYNLPASVTVTIGGSSATLTTDYTWSSSTGVLTVLAAKVTGNISISATGVAKTTTLTFDPNTANHGTAGNGGATATYDATALTSVTHTTPAAGYQLDGYYTTATDDPTTGVKIVNAAGTLVASTSYTTAGGAWHSELANLTLYARYTDKSYSVTHTFTNASRSSGGTTGTNAATHGTDYSVVVAATSGYVLPSTITVTIGGSTKTVGTEYTWNQGTGTVTIGGSYITGDIVITITSDVDCPSANSGAVVYKWEVKSNVTDGNICSTQNVAVSLNTTTHLTTLTGGTLEGLVTSSSMNNLAFSSGRIQYANGTAGVLILTLNCAIKTGDIIRFVNYSSNNGKYNYLRHTSSSTTTNQITLNASTTAGTVQEIVVPSAFNNKEELYIVAGSNTTGISYFEIIRPYVVTLDANTNGGKVGGENTATYYAASGEEIALPHAFKSDNYFNGWFPNASTGDAVSNPYTPTGSTTLYAQFGDCPDDGTVYKFQVATGLTNGNVTEGEVNLGNYVSALEGGSLTAHQNSSKLTIVSNSKIQFADNNVYLKIDLDCALQTGDKFITSIETDKLCITNTGSRSTTNELVVGTKTETDVPAAFVGSKTLWIWRNGTDSKITYFEVYRPEGFAVTYHKNDGSAATQVNTVSTVEDNMFTRNGYTFVKWHTEADGTSGVDKAVGAAVTAAIDLYAIWECTTPTFGTDLSTTPHVVREGDDAVTLTVAASANSGTVTYQWYSNTSKSTAGATTLTTGATYNAPTSSLGTLYYYCVATNTTGGGCTAQSAYATVTVNEAPCFEITDAGKNGSSWPKSNGNTIANSDIDGTITDGTVTYTGSGSLTGNDTHGIIFDNDNDELTISLSGSHALVAGSVITIVQHGNSSTSKETGFKVSGNSLSPATCDNGSTAYKEMTQTYTVAAADGIAGTSGFTIKWTGTNQVYLKSITVTGCVECTPIDPELSYSKTTIWMDDATLTATPTVNKDGSTGSVSFVSGNTDVATVDPSTGVVTAVARGTATIMATIAADGTHCGKTATCVITVKDMECGNTTIAKATRSGTSASYSGVEGGSALVNNLDGSNYKLKSGGYVGVQLPSTLSFEAGDIVRIDLTIGDWWNGASAGELPVVVYADNTGTNEIYRTDNYTKLTAQVVEFTVTSSMLTALATKQVTVYRQSSTETQNHVVNSVEIKRYACPDVYVFDAADNGLWSDEDNWIGPAGHGSGLPTIDDRAIITKPITVDIAHATAAAVILDQSSTNTGKLTIEANKGLEVAGTVTRTTTGSNSLATREEDLVLESSSAGNASLIFNNSNGDAATVQMYSKASINRGTNTWNWQYVGTPFTGSIPLYNYYGSWMYKWNNGWDPVTGGEILNPFVGYCLTQESATTHVMGGTLVPTTSKSVTMAASTDMVLANSWTAPIWIGGFTEETFTSEPATIYLFNTGMGENDGNGNYKATGEGTEAGTYVTVPVNSAPYTGSELIAPMQGFFVTTYTGAAGTITMNYNDLVRPSGVHTGIVAGPMKAPRRAKVADAKPDVMKIWANGSEYNDRVVILAREDFSEGFDNGWDGEKLSFGNASPSVYVINEEGGYDAVSAIPEYEGTLVGFRAGSEDNVYTMTFEYNGDEVLYLNDLKAQMSAEIATGQTYMFTTEEGDSEVRFIISHNPIRRITTGVDDVETGTKARKVLINEKIYIIRKGRVYSVDGQIVK